MDPTTFQTAATAATAVSSGAAIIDALPQLLAVLTAIGGFLALIPAASPIGAILLKLAGVARLILPAMAAAQKELRDRPGHERESAALDTVAEAAGSLIGKAIVRLPSVKAAARAEMRRLHPAMKLGAGIGKINF